MKKLVVKDLKYSYIDGNKKNYVLKGINLEFEPGDLYTIIGESGSGKTTLLSLIAALDNIQDGDILYDNKSLKKIGNGNFRLHYVDVIFQAYNLITYMTARENVEVALDIGKVKVDSKKEYSYSLLENVGINHETADRLVLKLSGGEQQRVAIARSMAQNNPIILADEPTGNLDNDTEEKIIELFKDLAKKGKIVIVVSHSKVLSGHADVVYKMKNGLITNVN